MSDPMDDIGPLWPDSEISPRTILKGRKSMFKVLLKTVTQAVIAIVFLVGGFYAIKLGLSVNNDWTKYLPTGQETLAKAIMRVCEDKEICPNGPSDAAKIKISYPNSPERAPASPDTTTTIEKRAEVQPLDQNQGPLAALPLNNTGKRLIGFLANITPKGLL